MLVHGAIPGQQCPRNNNDSSFRDKPGTSSGFKGCLHEAVMISKAEGAEATCCLEFFMRHSLPLAMPTLLIQLLAADRGGQWGMWPRAEATPSITQDQRSICAWRPGLPSQHHDWLLASGCSAPPPLLLCPGHPGPLLSTRYWPHQGCEAAPKNQTRLWVMSLSWLVFVCRSIDVLREK